MAVDPSDLFVVQSQQDNKLYKLTLEKLIAEVDVGDALDDGTIAGQVLQWNGTAWVPSLVIDCGVKNLGNGEVDYPD